MNNVTNDEGGYGLTILRNLLIQLRNEPQSAFREFPRLLYLSCEHPPPQSLEIFRGGVTGKASEGVHPVVVKSGPLVVSCRRAVPGRLGRRRKTLELVDGFDHDAEAIDLPKARFPLRLKENVPWAVDVYGPLKLRHSRMVLDLHYFPIKFILEPPFSGTTFERRVHPIE
ncbi:MAG: hypothetical protein QOE79_2582 [Sphingomonadales bacterium]|nr:hypothetical protein [Sphingomonadales bacterium]